MNMARDNNWDPVSSSDSSQGVASRREIIVVDSPASRRRDQPSPRLPCLHPLLWSGFLLSAVPPRLFRLERTASTTYGCRRRQGSAQLDVRDST